MRRGCATICLRLDSGECLDLFSLSIPQTSGFCDARPGSMLWGRVSIVLCTVGGGDQYDHLWWGGLRMSRWSVLETHPGACCAMLKYCGGSANASMYVWAHGWRSNRAQCGDMLGTLPGRAVRCRNIVVVQRVLRRMFGLIVGDRIVRNVEMCWIPLVSNIGCTELSSAILSGI